MVKPWDCGRARRRFPKPAFNGFSSTDSSGPEATAPIQRSVSKRSESGLFGAAAMHSNELLLDNLGKEE